MKTGYMTNNLRELYKFIFDHSCLDTEECKNVEEKLVRLALRAPSYWPYDQPGALGPRKEFLLFANEKLP
jgi:hypothetical protein